MAKILIVDDRPANRELLVTLLGYAGHHLWEAVDGEQGLVITRAEHPDLIITDIVMPKMDGYEFARQVRADPSISKTQIIFHTSSYIVEETRQLAAACGVSLVIGKPIEPQAFLEQIQATLAKPAVANIKTQPEQFHHEHMRLLTDTLANKVEELEAEIVERRQIEKRLVESEQRYHALFENSPISIWEEDFSEAKQRLNTLKQKGITDLRTYFTMRPKELMNYAATVRIVDVNKAALQMYEAKSREDMLNNLKHFFYQNAPESFLEELIAVAQGQATFHWEGDDRTLTGRHITISLNWTVAPGYEDSYLKVIVSTIDVTQRKLNEQATQQYAADLERRVEERTIELTHANRAKSEFLANMSHELRTPLNSILGLSEALLEQSRGPLNEKQVQALHVIAASGTHLLGLINDILEVSKIEAEKLQIHPDIISVKDVCESSLNFVRELAIKKSITLDFWNRQEVSTMFADPQRLKQILINLLNNAVKFTPEKGNVSLEVDLNDERDQIQFVITDNGIGIATDDLKKLFSPFMQVDSSLARQYQGTGLGLTIAYKLTELQGGSVHVESAVGEGSRFMVSLPWDQTHTVIRKTSQIEKNVEPAQESRHILSPLVKVLLADDHEINTMMLGDYLQSHGYEVTTARNGLEAIARAEDTQPNIIIMDIQMPEMDGLEAIQHLRADQRFISTPIIALTALAMSGDRERCLEAGANEYMSKPVSLKALAGKIGELVRQGG